MTAAEAARVVAARDAVLSGSEFHLNPTWFETYVLPWLIDAQDWMASLSPVTYAVVMSLGLIIVVALMAHVFVSFARQGRLAREAGLGANGEESLTARKDAARLRDEAASARAEGRHADAVRLAWLASLAMLDEAGVSRDVQGRADFEHVAAARHAASASAPAVEALARAFQEIRFGGAAVDGTTATRCLDVLTQVEEGLGHAPA